MTRRGVSLFAFVLFVAAGGPAAADEELAPAIDPEPGAVAPTKPEPSGSEPPADDAPKDHDGQLGVGIQFPIGVRAIAPYDGEWCGVRGSNENPNAEICVGRTPATIDFELAYGVKANLELLLELRVGLERDFGMTETTDGDGPRLFRWSPGVKFYFSEARISKLFSTVQLAFDHTGYEGEAGTDFFFRNVNGMQFDLHPSYGLYLYVGEEMAFRRWLWFGVEAGIGIQGRYP